MSKISSYDIWIILAGYLAAIHVGKLSAVIPILQKDLNLSFTQAGLSLSLVQGAGMLFALCIGAVSEKIGLKKCLIFALILLGMSSFAGLWIDHSISLYFFRFMEGIGFLTISLCAPAILKRLSTPETMNFKMGLWSSYMGVGVSLAILTIPVLLEWLSWQHIWALFGALCWLVALMIYHFLRYDDKQTTVTTKALSTSTSNSFLSIVKVTVTHPPILCLAVIFACYTSQWITLTGFLPSLYVSFNMDLKLAGILVSMVVLSNLGGTFGAGVLLQKGIAPFKLLQFSFLSLILCSWVVFSQPYWLIFELQYLCAILFSFIGGIIPTTVFANTLRYAPQVNAAASSMGLVLQISACAQFLVPPATAALVSSSHQWSNAAWVTVSLSTLGLLTSYYLFKIYTQKKEPI